MKKETLRRIWYSFEAIAYDPLAEISARIERPERIVADRGKRSETSAWQSVTRLNRDGSAR